MTPHTFKAAFKAAAATGMGLVAFRPHDAGAYGRVILDGHGLLDRIALLGLELVEVRRVTDERAERADPR